MRQAEASDALRFGSLNAVTRSCLRRSSQLKLSFFVLTSPVM